MSAYVVPDEMISALAQWACDKMGNASVSYLYAGSRRYMRNEQRRIASVLDAENVRSVNARYRENDTAEGFVFKRDIYLNLSAVEVLKALNGYSYQACEADAWEESEAYAIVQGIKEAAIRCLPGYEEAAWIIERRVAS